MKRLHVTGCHRSGTTLMFELLTASYQHDGHCEHEQTIFNPPPDPGTDLFISKKPSDITHISRVLRGDPNLALIYMLRDPRAVVTSIHPSKPDVYFASFERWLRYEQAARMLSGHPRMLEVRYEQLVADPVGTQERLERAFPFLVQRYSFDAFAATARASEPATVSLGGIRPVSADSLEGWRSHLRRLAFQVSRYPMLPDKLIEYGYEQDRAWLKLLEGVAPLEQDYGEKRPPAWQRLETDLRYWWKSRVYLRNRRPPRRRSASG